jgi:hypothetical protein
MKLLPAIAIAALATVVPAASAVAASPETGPIVTVELELEASHGLQAQLETSDDETVTLMLWQAGRFVSYEVRGEVTEAGLKVRFGQLGLIDVAFTPTKTLSATEPSAGCTGAPRTLREGVFTGTIDFTGEREYVRIEGPQAEGSMSLISQWECLEDPGPFAPFAGVSRSHETDPEEESEHASLHADSRRCMCSFSAGIHHRDRKGRRGRSIFSGTKSERREGMEIFRGTSAFGPPSAFVFNHEAGTATLRPPRPFSGRATFKRRPGGRALWRSTIRVPMLGADPVRPQGRGFFVGLYPEYHFD